MRDGHHLHVHGEDQWKREKRRQTPDGNQGEDGRRHFWRRSVGGRVHDDLIPETRDQIVLILLPGS